MDQNVARKMFDLQMEAAEDPQYMSTLDHYRRFDRQYLKLLPTLTKKQRYVIENYVGLLFDLHVRQLELICTRHEIS